MLSLRPSKLRLVGWAAAFLSVVFLPPAVAGQSQSDNTSVAEAARRAREQKKNSTKPTRTLTNDDLPPALTEPAQPAGTQPVTDEASAADQTKPHEKAAPPKDAPAEPADALGGKHAQTEAALKRAKAELAQAQSELDVLQRKVALDNDAYYSRADYARDTEGKAKLDADAQQVNDKKSQVEELKAKVAALEAELGETAEPEKPARG